MDVVDTSYTFLIGSMIWAYSVLILAQNIDNIKDYLQKNDEYSFIEKEFNNTETFL